MATLGAELTMVGDDGVEIILRHRDEFTQQHGCRHTGIVSTVLDTACGLAALFKMPPDTAVLAVEYKINFVNPAKADQFVVWGRVLKSGRTLSVCAGDAFALTDEGERHVAILMSTAMTVRDRNLVD